MNEPAVEIPVERLREALDVLLQHLADRAPDGRLAVPTDAFWSVPTASLGNVYADPPELTIGMVSEAWEQVDAMINDETRVVGYGLVWLGDVLRAIGAEFV